MAELPKIVRERRSYQAVGEHPDANLLSAFAEHGLTNREREQVLDHLSHCADCRQIVALTTSGVTEERPVGAAARAPAGAKPSWWRSPLLHWGTFTAAALVILIAVGARMRLREGRSASAPAVATVNSNEAAQKSAAEAPEVPARAAEQKESARPAEAQTTRHPIEMAARAKTAETVTGGAIGALAGATGNVAAKNAPPAPPPAALPMKPQPSVDEIEGSPAGAVKETYKVHAQAVPSPSVAARQAVEVAGGAGRPTAAVPGVKSEAAVPSPSRDAMLTKRASLGSRWSVSGSGALQRSFDGGRSWKEAAVGDGVTFRAVATVGSDVWAGGSGGALFHSADGGEHWSQVLVQAKDRAPSGDVVRIEFADAQNGTVTTSSGEVWTTSDAGATWRLQ